MTAGKALTIKEQTLLDSLKRASRQSPAEKIKLSLKLSNFCFKLFDAANRKGK
jgi:hypothetical protein